jgi:hypothetical protein
MFPDPDAAHVRDLICDAVERASRFPSDAAFYADQLHRLRRRLIDLTGGDLFEPAQAPAGEPDAPA